MNFPLVTVIIAVKNGEKYIEKALLSVLGQQYEPLEVLVVDGNSTDKTLSIARAFPNVKIIRQIGKGIANAYNTGIRQANGDFIAFLSHDDFWTKGKLKIQIEFMSGNSELLFTVGRVKFFLDDENYIPPGFRCELLKDDHIGYIMETLTARRKVFDLVGFFDEKLAIAQDVDWFARAKDLGVTSAVVPKVLLRKIIHKTNIHLQSKKNNFELLRAVKNSINRKHPAKSELKFYD